MKKINLSYSFSCYRAQRKGVVNAFRGNYLVYPVEVDKQEVISYSQLDGFKGQNDKCFMNNFYIWENLSKA